jgi:uncharacterized membrane protein YccC
MTFDGVAAVLGWIGTTLLLLAYWLVSTKRVSGDGAHYQVLNIGGSVGLGVASVAGGVWSSVALNLIWGCIGVVVLVNLWRRRRDRRPPQSPTGPTPAP